MFSSRSYPVIRSTTYTYLRTASRKLQGHDPWYSRVANLFFAFRRHFTVTTAPELPTSKVTFRSCGATFKATYADDGDPNGPVIVCLHGSPSSHKDFNIISPYLLSAGVRLVVPNFPECGYCTVDGDSYNFSPEHKSLFLKDLFEAIGVDRISVLVSHSASGATTGHFCADNNLVDSVAFLSAINIRPHRPAKSPVRMAGLKVSSQLMKTAILGKFLRKICPPIAIKLSGFRVGDPSYMVGMIHEMAQVNWPKTAENLKLLHKSSVPVLVIGCEEDRTVEVEIAQETMDLLHIDQSNDVLYVNADGVCTNGSMQDHKHKRRRGIIFATGGHWIQNSHPQLIAMAILDLLKTTEK